MTMIYNVKYTICMNVLIFYTVNLENVHLLLSFECLERIVLDFMTLHCGEHTSVDLWINFSDVIINALRYFRL